MQERLGHANVGATLYTYSRVTPDPQKAPDEGLMKAMLPVPQRPLQTRLHFHISALSELSKEPHSPQNLEPDSFSLPHCSHYEVLLGAHLGG